MKRIAHFRKVLILGCLLVASLAAFAAGETQQTAGPTSAPSPQTATGSTAIDIQQFEVLKLDRTPIEKLVVYHDVLTFKNSDIRISMGDSVELAEGIEPWAYYYCGYTDPKSLKVDWLIQGKIFRATWQTFACGSGIFDTQVDVLVLVEGNKGRELLRQSFTITARCNSEQHTNTTVTFSAAERNGAKSANILRTVETEDVYVESDSSISLPLGNEDHRQMSVVREVTRYELRPNGTLFENLSSDASMDLSAKYVNREDVEVNVYKNDISLDELADFLVVYVNPRFGLHRGTGVCTPQERQRMIRGLKERNSGIADKPFCAGTIVIPHQGILFPPRKPGQAPAG